MIPDNNIFNLEKHFNYTVEKEAFLNSLSDEDLLFIKNIICGKPAEAPTEVAENQKVKNQLQAKKLNQVLDEFEHPTTIKNVVNYFSSWIVVNYFSSWIWSPPKPILDASQKADVIKTICSNFTQPYLLFETSSGVLTFEPEIGMYEELFKEPPIDNINEHKTWQTGQDNYWRQIAYAIGYDLPKPLPEIEIVNSQTDEIEKRQPTVAQHVRQYLKDYRANILKEEKAVYVRDGEQFPAIKIPEHIRGILKNKPTIQNFLEAKKWKDGIDKKKIQWILEGHSDIGMIELNSPTVLNSRISDKEIADGFDKHLEYFINKGFFNNLQNISLDLSDLNLSIIPESIGKIPGVKHLDLRGNRLTGLPKSLGNFTELTSLDLSGNQIVSLPTFMVALINQLSDLEELMLSGTSVDSPLDFSRLTHLKILNLQHVKDLDFIKHLPDLERLSIATNELEILPDFIGDLKKLKVLEITGGTLKNISSVGNLVGLIILDLDNNQIKVVPKSIGGLSALKILKLTGNLIEFLPDDIERLTALAFLHLDNNQISVVPQMMGNLRNLNFLDLTGNPLPAEIPNSLGNVNRSRDRSFIQYQIWLDY